MKVYLKGSLPEKVPGLELVDSPEEADLVAVAAPRAGILKLAGSVVDGAQRTVVISDFTDREKALLKREGVRAVSFPEFGSMVRSLAPPEGPSAGVVDGGAGAGETMAGAAGQRPGGRAWEAVLPPVGQGMVIPVGSTKGGVGKSTIAVNLAVFLSYVGTTVLVDFDAAHGDVAATAYLERRPAVTVANWEPASWENLNSSPRATGMKVLPFFDKNAHGLEGNFNLGVDILSSLRKHFDYVVVDLGVFSDLWCINAAVSAADIIVLVVDQSDKCLIEMTSFIHLEANSASRSRMRLLVNKVGLEPIHTTGEIQRALGFESCFEVPFDPVVGRAVMRKTFPVLLRKSKAGRAMQEIFAYLFERGKEPDRGRSRVPAAILAASGLIFLLAVAGLWVTAHRFVH